MKKNSPYRRRLFVSAFVAGVLVGALHNSFADDRLGGGISNEEGADQIQARVADWQNDLDQLAKSIPSTCAVSSLDEILLPSQPGAIVSPEFAALARIHPRLTLSVPRGAVYPLRDALLRATAPVVLTVAEKAERDRLRASQATSDTEVIGLEIEAQKFLIRVVNRIYDSAIDYSRQRAENDRLAGGVFGRMYAEQDQCAADTIQSERDVALLAGARSILPLYDELSATESAAATGTHRTLR